MVFWTGRQEQYRTTPLQLMWGLMYPWLIYEGASILVTAAYMVFRMMMDPSLLASMKDTDQYIRTMNSLINENYVLIAFFTCLIAIPLMLLFMHLDRKKEERMRMTRECWELPGVPAFALCLVCGAAVCVVFNHLLMYSGLYDLLSSSFEPVADLLYSGSLLMEIIAVGILTPVVEELIFRGLIYRRLRWALEAKWAAVVSALIFAVFHGNLLQGIYAFAIGLLLAFVCERYHHIMAPICIHVGANVISVLMSENTALQKIYESNTAFLVSTLVMMAVFVASFYLILTKIMPARLEPPASQNE